VSPAESRADWVDWLTSSTVLIVWKGGASRIKLTDGETVGVIFGVGAGVSLIVTVFFLPWLYRLLIRDDWQLRWWHIFQGPLLLRRGEAPPLPEGYVTVQDYYRGHMTMEQLQAQRAGLEHKPKPEDLENNGELSKETATASSDGAVNSPTDGAVTPSPAPDHTPIVGPRPEGSNFHPAVLFWYFKRVFFHGVEKDIVSLQKKRNILSGDLELMHAHAKHYDNKAEYMYSFLQILTAATASFSHGANDVSKYVLTSDQQ